MDAGTLNQSLRKVLDIDNEVYSTRLAFLFCLVLSAFLWWIPVLGPAVAGYVCGRKTGSMVKGLLCSLAAGTVLILAVWGLSALVLGHGGYPGVPADEAAGRLTGIVGAAASYLKAFFVGGTSGIDLMGLGVVTVFGGVGGLLSRQARKEAAFLIATGSTEGSVRPVARSMLAYGRNKELGFKSFDDCIATQRMTTNENRDASPGRKTEAERANPKEGRPVATTVQTVTTTVAGSSATQSKDRWSPFSDILERSDLKQNK